MLVDWAYYSALIVRVSIVGNPLGYERAYFHISTKIQNFDYLKSLARQIKLQVSQGGWDGKDT
jgi:hypothetical protein